MPRISPRTYDKVSKAVIGTFVLGAAITSPYFGIAIVSAIGKEISKRLGPDTLYDPEEVRKSLYYLKRHKFIKYRVISDNKVVIELTGKGKKRFSRYKFEDLKILEPVRWDGKWRLVIFDIPEKKKVARDALRDKLKKLGFFQIQKSVWAYPYECGDEIELICEYFGVKHYVLFFATLIKDDLYLRKYFNVKFGKYKLETGVL